jgi:hypothetical protein
MNYLKRLTKNGNYYIFADHIGTRYVSKSLKDIAFWYASYVKHLNKKHKEQKEMDANYAAISKVDFTLPNNFKVTRLLLANLKQNEHQKPY